MTLQPDNIISTEKISLSYLKKGDQRLKLECIDYIFSFMLHACLHQLHKKNAVSIQMSIEMNDLPDRSIEIV